MSALRCRAYPLTEQRARLKGMIILQVPSESFPVSSGYVLVEVRPQIETALRGIDRMTYHPHTFQLFFSKALVQEDQDVADEGSPCMIDVDGHYTWHGRHHILELEYSEPGVPSNEPRANLDAIVLDQLGVSRGGWINIHLVDKPYRFKPLNMVTFSLSTSSFR
jgi:hypothetical protein